MAKNFIIERLKDYFNGKDIFSRQELYDFYRQFEPNLKDSTFRWRIYQLKEKKIISSISKSEYTLSYRPVFKPVIENRQKAIFLKIRKQFPYIKTCIWTTKYLNEFMLHLPGRFMTLLEVEKDVTESVFHYLLDLNYRNIYIQPEKKEIEKYIYENHESIIVKSLTTKAPLQKIKKIHVPTLEKIWVDLFCDHLLYNAFQGTELIYIYNNSHKKYEVNFTRLFYYAKRRNKKNELRDYLSLKTDIPKNILND